MHAFRQTATIQLRDQIGVKFNLFLDDIGIVTIRRDFG